MGKIDKIVFILLPLFKYKIMLISFRFYLFKQPRDYHFDYFVSDPHTGDHKSQWEVKEKGVVRGGYSLVEPDGTTRVVEYIADDHGFRAVVKKIGTPVHPPPAPVVHQHAPIVAAPAPVHIPAPQPIVVEEPQPLLYNGYDAYNGHYENYVPALPEYRAPASVEIPKVVVPQVYQQAYQPAPAPVASYFPVEKPLDERVEYHGFTGNDDDDSAYTKYGQDESGERGGEGLGYEYNFEETRPQLISVPYKFAADYQKPLVYYLQQKF